MVDKSSGNSKKKASDESGVLASLPSTRPARMSRRARAGDDPATTTPATGGGEPKRAGKARSAPAGSAPKAKPKAGTSARSAKSASTTKPKAAKAGTPGSRRDEKPQPVRAGDPALTEPARKAADKRDQIDEVPASGQSGTDLAVTVVKAAGELAQIGATLGGQVIKRAVRRIPRP